LSGGARLTAQPTLALEDELRPGMDDLATEFIELEYARLGHGGWPK